LNKSGRIEKEISGKNSPQYPVQEPKILEKEDGP
jgi:hypothetical protein